MSRAPATIERRVNRLLHKYQLRSIEFTATVRGMTGRAMPDENSPIVSERRTALFAKVPGNTVSLDEIDAIHKASLATVGRAVGATFAEVIDVLQAVLEMEAERRAAEQPGG